MGSLFMPKMRAIGVPVNDYFVEHFVDIPKYRYNKIPLKTVTKTESGFQLKLNVDDQPEYFIDRKEVMAPTSGGNTSNVFLNMVALYAAMQIDIQFKVIVPEDQSSIAQQDLNRFIYKITQNAFNFIIKSYIKFYNFWIFIFFIFNFT